MKICTLQHFRVYLFMNLLKYDEQNGQIINKNAL